MATAARVLHPVAVVNRRPLVVALPWKRKAPPAVAAPSLPLLGPMTGIDPHVRSFFFWGRALHIPRWAWRADMTAHACASIMLLTIMLPGKLCTDWGIVGQCGVGLS
jgi:hypothetical protein